METGPVRRWLAAPARLVHLSVLVALPLIIYLVMEVGELSRISYFVFPPLASATFTVFFDPDGVYSTPPRLIGGLTLGAVAGWMTYTAFGYTPVGAAVAVLGTSLVTWPLELEHPSAYSTALLGVVLQADSLLYVAAVFASTVVVAAVFTAWRSWVYEERARYLYDAVRDEDRVLVPAGDDRVVEMAGRIAGAHDDGRVVLLAFGGARGDLAERAEALAEEHGVRTETVVADPDADRAGTLLDAAERYDCSVIAVPWDEDLVDPLFHGPVDVVAFDGTADEPADVFVPVKGAGSLPRLAVELGSRLTRHGDVSVATVVHSERARRPAEKELFSLVSAFTEAIEERDDMLDTRIIDAGDRSTADVLVDVAEQYDLTLVGASTGRSLVSRLADPPLSAELRDRIDGPVAVVHGGDRGVLARFLDRIGG